MFYDKNISAFSRINKRYEYCYLFSFLFLIKRTVPARNDIIAATIAKISNDTGIPV